MVRGALCITAFALVGALMAGPVQAEPALQLYIEGATYVTDTQTWVINSNSFRLWAIASYDPATEYIENVRLASAFFTDERSSGGSISITGTTIGGTGSYGGFTQSPATAAPNPTFNYESGDGDNPVLNGGPAELAEHGVYQAGVSFIEWGLGDFTTHNSQLADFAIAFPTPHATKTAEIRAYDVVVSGFASGVHFDLYDTITANTGASLKTTFAPFSHDAGAIPEPGTLVLLGTSVLTVAGSGLRFRRRRTN